MKKICREFLLLILLMLLPTSFVKAEGSAVLVNGKSFNEKIKKLVGNQAPSEKGKGYHNGVYDTTVKNISFFSNGNVPDVDISGMETVDVSNSSDGSVVAYYDGEENIYIVSSSAIKANSDMSMMFGNFQALENIDFENLDTSQTTSMADLFYNCYKLKEADLSGFNTNSLTTMTSLFDGCKSLTSVNLSSFDTSKVTRLGRVFYGCSSLTSLDLSSFDTSNVKSFSSMFNQCSSLTSLDLSSFDTSGATEFGSMFRDCSALSQLNISNFNTTNVKNMNYMFSGCSSLSELDVSGFDISNLEYCEAMFKDCSSLKEIDLSNFNNTKVKTFNEMFAGCSSLSEIDLSGFKPKSVSSVRSLFNGCSSLKKVNIAYISTPTDNKYNYSDMFKGCAETIEKITVYEGANVSSFFDDIVISDDDGNAYKVKWVNTSGELSDTVTANTSDTYTRILIDADEPIYRASDYKVWEVHSPEVTYRAYCLNLYRKAADGNVYDKVEGTNERIAEELVYGDCGYEPLGSNMREALITLIYYGARQEEIWSFTNRYSELDLSTVPEEWRYENIPNKEDIKLFIYKAVDSAYQNLLTIEGVNYKEYGGVLIYKYGSDGSALAGAEFTIYDSEGNEVKTITSNKSGKAAIYKMDEENGLVLGTYTIKESKAPDGYQLSDNIQTFKIESDQQFVTLNIDGEAMIFTNKDDGEERGGLKIFKQDSNSNPLVGAEFTIYDSNNNEVLTITSDEEGIAQTNLRSLLVGETYTIKESKAPSGYKLSEEIKTVTISEANTYYSEVLNFTNESKKGSANIEVSKLLEKGTLLGEDFNFNLYKQEIDEEGNASWTLLETVTNDSDGKISFSTIEYDAEDLGYYNYKITEVNNGENGVTYDEEEIELTITISDNGSDELLTEIIYWNDIDSFTNSLETVDIKGIKTWNDKDNQDGKRPESITINLYGDDELVDTVEINEEDEWQYSFTNLNKYYKGEEINYTIKEEEVAYYETEYDGYDITNTYNPDLINFSVSKKWIDNDDSDGFRPQEITVCLLANEEIKETITLNEDNDWQYSFVNLAKYSNGEEITYSIQEVEVDKYTSNIEGDVEEGFTITNTHEIEKVHISGAKTWEGNGYLPLKIAVRLYANDEETDYVAILEESNNWTFSFNDLAKYSDGELIDYYIVEIDVPKNYTPSYKEAIIDEDSIILNLVNIYEEPEIPNTKTPEPSETPKVEKPTKPREVPNTSTR